MAIWLVGACVPATAQEMPLLNLSPPPFSVLSVRGIWHPSYFVPIRAPSGHGEAGLADISPEPPTLSEAVLWLVGLSVVERAQSGHRTDGLIDLSPPPRKFHEVLFDNWPSGLLLPRRAHVAPPHGIANISPPQPTFMYAGGLEGWYHGAFAYGAVLWSPYGLYDAGFTVKLLSGGGFYRYNSGALRGAEVTGVQQIASLMPGWRFKADKFEATVYAGLDMQQHSLSRVDPGASLSGYHYGVCAGADLWHEPQKGVMVAANVSVSSIGPSYSARIATGWWVADAIWLGPEATHLGNPAYGGPSYMQWRVGAHATGFWYRGFEFSAAAGYARDSDRRQGAYGRFSLLARY